MATAESLVKSINRRLSEIEKYFGKNSFEYHKAKNVVWQELGGGMEALLKYDKGKVSISRSKRVIEAIEGQDYLYDIVQEVWRTISRQGTVRQMAMEYLNNEVDFKELQKDNYKNLIRELSEVEYRSSYVDDDIYDETDNLLAKENEKYGTDNFDETFFNALSDIKDIFREKGEHRDYKYARAEKLLEEAKMAHEQFLINRVMENAEEPAEV